MTINEGEKVVVAKLMPDKEDITINSIEKFEEEIAKAKTILVAGPIGKYEEEGHRQGTQRVFTAVANSNAYKVAGGGDTEEALTTCSVRDKFDWVSVGGGAMLEYLAKGTLPGIEALVD
jgi:phosphoglycerate kinase